MKTIGKGFVYRITALTLVAVLLVIPASAENLLIMPSPSATDPWGLKLELTNVTSTGATLIVSHSGDDPTGKLTTGAEYFMLGEAYGLEVWNEGDWEVLPLLREWVVLAIGYGMAAGDSREFQLNWEMPYGELPAGRYRVIKDISYQSREAHKTLGTKNYYAEFTITAEETAGWNNPFTDVYPNDTYYDAVKYVYENGLMQGKSANYFAPVAPTTRGQIVTILWRIENMPVANYILPFSDVAQEYYYTEAIRWAAAEHIVEGYSDGTFHPDMPISRQQLVTILWRYAKHSSMDVSVGEETNILSYNDVFNVGEYAIPAMQWACGSGVMCGHGDGNLRPLEIANRGETAQMFFNFLK